MQHKKLLFLDIIRTIPPQKKTKFSIPIVAILLIIFIVLIARNTIEDITHKNEELQIQVLCYKAQIEQLFEHYNHTIHDPTLNEMTLFLECDDTDKTEYSEKNWNCINFSISLIANATLQGLRCGFVILDFDQISHAVVAFHTDRGMIYIDPQCDIAVHFEIGKTYPNYGKLKTINVIWI